MKTRANLIHCKIQMQWTLSTKIHYDYIYITCDEKANQYV